MKKSFARHVRVRDQHLKNLFEDGELEPSATVKESLSVQIESSREVRRRVTLYNLDAILAVGTEVMDAKKIVVPGGDVCIII